MAIPLSLSEVPAATPYVQYVATSGQTVFPYPFPITQDSDLIVVYNGVTLATDAGYTLSGQGNDKGGNVTFTAGATAGDIVTLYRDIAIERLTQIGQNSGFSASAFNAEFNNLYLICQQLEASIGQCLQIPNTNNPAPVTGLTPGSYANKYLAFDGNGNPEPAALTSSGSITGSILAGILSTYTVKAVLPTNVQTDAEIAAGVMPTNFSVPNHTTIGAVLGSRYGTTTADGTGVINASAINNAFAVANQIAGGAKILLGSGNFNVNALLTGYSNTYLIGQGKGMGNNAVTAGTSITQLSNAADVIDFPNASSCGLRDIALIPGSGGGGVVWSATGTNQCYYFELENVAVDLTAHSAGVGIWLNPVGTQADLYFPRFRNVTVTGGSGNTWDTKVGIRLGNSASTFPVVYGDFSQLLITNVQTGLDLQGLQNSVFHGVVLYNVAGGSGIGVKGTGVTSYNYIYGLMMEDGTIDTFVNWAAGCFDNTIFMTGDVTNTLTKVTDSNGSNEFYGDGGSSGFTNKFGRALDLYSVRSITVGDNATPAGTAMKLYYSTTTAVNPGAIAAGATAEVTISVAGMVVTDQVIASPQAGTSNGLAWCAYAVSGGYRIRVANVTTGSITPASTLYNVTVFR